ncbi:Alpha/Beta hydrolase protein [Dactylonectria estremocensis]|uniref:Carboxylic ester hydrolase n=1 Tax=Dactylonectria estremocensis TaxID=1079267 RepID=A0A9P9DQ30_9HYPO|nr:Alpha/Beta hydrolase protein [Dactylonectria estremocensis]
MAARLCTTWLSWVLVALLCICSSTLALPSYDGCAPVAITRNGTFRGLHLPKFSQDQFLGVPFAQQPVGDLRLRHPVSLNQSWHGVRNATRKSHSCPGYAGFDKDLDLGEDCLTLDIVRPAGVRADDGLPVYVWIYGGGFTAGGSADSRYNTSYLVNASVAIDKPIIAVSLNYRVGGWGFLSSKQMREDGALNIGLFDQRLALKWIQENIRGFGGNPRKVTIAGESAGAFSVGYHLVGFGGDNEDLFRAAILQSGSALGPGTNQAIYNNVTETVGCSKHKDPLQCLRKVNYKTLFKALEPFVVTPVIDGVFLKQLPSESFKEGKVANVAVLLGSNTDEGTAAFFGPRGTLNTNRDVSQLLSNMGSGLDQKTVRKLMGLYPDDPARGCPFNTGTERFEQHGWQYKRGAAIVGDQVIHAGRRATAQYFSSPARHHRKPVYTYRFDQSPWDNTEELVATEAPVYSTHYAEICFVFNIEPSASRNNSNWIGPDPEYYQLSKLMSRSFISFVYGLDPNHHGIRGVPKWPEYGRGENYVFKVKGLKVEKDNWRKLQLEYWNQIWAKLNS